MADVELIKTFEQIKTLADARRLAILRLLMAQPATLTQLGRAMGEHPAWVRHHLKQLERAGLVEMSDLQVSGGFVEKFYRAKARAFVFQEMILPDTSDRETIVMLGSHDLAINLLSQQVHQAKLGIDLLALPVGSLEGLVALRQGVAHITGCHLLDIESGEYNRPYVRHFFPDRSMVMVTLAYREQGLLLAPGNPHQIRGLEDLVHKDVHLVNRNRGSGTRLWLDKQLNQLGIAADQVRGYNQEARTHTAVAHAIQQGRADIGLGLQAAAQQFGLDFIPLFQERYDLVLPQEVFENRHYHPMLEMIHSGEFRLGVEHLGGYNTDHTGDRLSL
jgi:putative molybdopterin biosynthesis protein